MVRVSVPGADIAIEGVMVRLGRLAAEKFDFIVHPPAVLQELREGKLPIDLFTFLQHPLEPKVKFQYPMEWDNLAVLPTSTYSNWWSDDIDNKTRNMVRRSEKKGVVVREVPFDDQLLYGIWQIYNECPVRQGRPFAHFGKDIETVKREAATFLDRSFFVGAFLETALIGFMKVTSDGNRSLGSIMNVVAMIRQRDKAPMNALVAQAVRSCAEKELSCLIYSNFVYGRKHPDSLSEFKRNNGFRRLDVPRYYVPLTYKGALAYRLGFHRRVVDRLPESVATNLRGLRDAWYSRKSNLSYR